MAEASEDKVERLNRLYSVLSRTNQAIIRASDRDSLFRDICRIAVEQGGFILAWIGLVDEDSGMHYIPSKGGTANPQDLLSSQQMRSFLERMRARYDLIVLDAPPVLAVSDPIILSHFVDTTIYLVRWETTPRPIVTGAVRMLRANGGEIAGVVLSRVNARKHATYGYGDNGYYYGRYSNYYGYHQST